MKLKPINIQFTSKGYIRFFVLLPLSIFSYPMISDVLSGILYVILDVQVVLNIPNDIAGKLEFINFASPIIDYILIVLITLYAIKKTVQMYNDIVIFRMKQKFRKAASIHNPSNKSAIHLSKN